MKGFDLIPHNTRIPFTSWRYIWVTISLAGMALSVFLFVTQGLNYGIDFRGGTLMEVKARDGAIDVGWLR